MKKICLLITVLLLFQASYSQTVSQYIFSTNGISSLATDLRGNVVDMSTGTATLIASGNDDVASSVAAIGFPFTFMSTGGTNNVFTQFSASSNGGIQLGTTAILGTLQAFPTSASTPVIAPYIGDLATSSTGKVHYKVFGSYPNRTLVVEFLNMSVKYNSGTVDGTFQARLYEQTNTIEFVYGAMKVGSASAPVNIGFYNTTGVNNEFSVNQSSPYTTTTNATPITNANSSTGNITGLNSSANGSRRAFVFTPTVAYKSQFISMNTGSLTWCAGETRNVTVTIKNIGTATWTNASPDINVGVKWNTNGTSWADYYVRVDANGLAPGATGTYTLPITASNYINGTGYTSPLSAGTNNLSFDVVEETISWLGDNGGNTGPGNIAYKSDNITISAPPSITAQPGNKSACQGSGTSFAVTATGTSLSYQWQVSTDNGSTWSNLSNTGVYTGVTAASLNISNVTGLNGYQYKVAVTSSGSCSATSSTGILTVNALAAASVSYTGSPYCSNGGTVTVTQTGTSGGTYSSTTGLSINSTTGAINTSASTAGTYTVTYSFTNGTCPNTTTASVTITALPVATFSYVGSPFCQNAANPSPTYGGGGAAGVFSSTTGLVFVSTSTGQINLSASTPGTYTVTNTRAAANGCSQVTATSSVIITAVPSATISYAGSPYCKSLTSGLITQNGTTGGTYSSTTGLSINTGTGEINPSTSTAGSYTITYTVASAGGCSLYSTTASVTITAIPVATFSYTGTPYCQNASNPSPTYSGGGAAGIYSSATGLVFVSTGTGQVNLSASTPGTYTVTNTRAAASGCSQVSATSSITITATPSATISYAGSPYCSTGGTATVTRTGTLGGTYSSTTGLVVNSTNGDITLGTSTAGTYTVTYTVAAAGGCSLYTTTASVTINAAPAIGSSGQPGNQTTCAGTQKTFTVNATGTTPAYQWQYSADGSTNWNNVVSGTPTNIAYTNTTTASLTVTPSSAASTGTYSYRCVVSVNNCSSINSNTASLTVNALPVATISYGSSPYCSNGGTATVTRTGTTGGTYSASPSGLIINSSSGDITLATSTAGTYTITYTFSNSTTNCSNTATTSVTVNSIPTGVTASATPNPVCAGSTVTLAALPSSSAIRASQNFNNGIGGWSLYNGSFGDSYTAAAWTIRDNGYSYAGTTFHSNDNSKFILSNSNAQIGFNDFPDITYTQVTSPVFSTVGLANCVLDFYQFYNYSPNDDEAAVLISTNGGSSWTTIRNYTDDQVNKGSASSFNHAIIDLSAYVNNPSVKIRFEYLTAYGDWWALDNVAVTGNGIGAPYTYAWTSTPSGFASSVQNPTATPTANTTYNLTVTNTYGCSTTASTAVTVNALPIASISPVSGSICEGATVQVNIAGTSGATINYQLNGTAQPTQTLPYNFNSPSNQGTYTYSLQSVTASGCTGTVTNGTSIITINPYPVVAAIGGSNYVQTNTTTQLTNTTAGGVWATSAATSASLSNTSGTPVTVTGVAEGTPNITYTVTTNSCPTTVSKSMRVYNPDYITKADGNFSNAATWHIDRDDNTFAEGVAVPTTGNYTSIRVINTLALDQDFQVQAGKSFSLVTVGGTMSISPSKVFSSGGTVNFNGKAVTVRSDATGTGAIGQMATAISNATNVTVERYIPKRRAWRLMTAPVTGTTIHAAWQEGSLYNNGVNTPAVTAGRGTLITGLTQGTAANANSHGFDFWNEIANSSSSLRYYDYATSTWINYTDINTVAMNDKPAYMLFVRGDRTVTTDTGATTLRATGVLKQGNVLAAISSSNGTTALISNPYASLVDFGKVYLNNTALLQDKFIFWNSKLSTYGAYEAVVGDGDGIGYNVVPNSFTPGGADNTVRFLQSGEGFFVYPKTGASGNVSIGEAAKSTSATGGTNPYRISAATESKLYVNLNIKNSDGTSTLADGIMLRYDDSYSAGIDEDDAAKQANFYENFGISSQSSSLIIEARPSVAKTDTVQIRMWNVGKKTYQVQAKAENFTHAATLHAFLEDRYTGTRQELSLTGDVTSVDFVVNSDTASYSATRFRIVFRNEAAVLPVTLTSVKAAPANGGVNVTWIVANEVNIKQYTVERSTDGGANYASIATQAAKNSVGAATTAYQSFDALPKTGDNLYRIRIESANGTVTYSSVVKVSFGQINQNPVITMYPNPVRGNEGVQLQLSNLPAGSYLLSLYSGGGQTVYQKKITVSQNNTIQTEKVVLNGALAQGSYSVKMSDSKGKIMFTDKLIVAR